MALMVIEWLIVIMVKGTGWILVVRLMVDLKVDSGWILVVNDG